MENRKQIKIIVLGSTGMLGNAVFKELTKVSNNIIFATYRKKEFRLNQDDIYFNVLETSLDKLPIVDYIINCIGIIKPIMNKNFRDSIYINSVFPLELANYCEKNNIKLIHASTNCVFHSKEGNNIETDIPTAKDSYGLSKFLGEPDNAMVIRTSIIGEELHNNVSLLEWVKSQKNKKVYGYHLWWNGITTKQYGICVNTIIEKNLWEKGIFHIFSPRSITKYKLVSLINDKFKLNLNIKETYPNSIIDMTLKTIKNLNEKLQIPFLESQIKVL